MCRQPDVDARSLVSLPVPSPPRSPRRCAGYRCSAPRPTIPSAWTAGARDPGRRTDHQPSPARRGQADLRAGIERLVARRAPRRWATSASATPPARRRRPRRDHAVGRAARSHGVFLDHAPAGPYQVGPVVAGRPGRAAAAACTRSCSTPGGRSTRSTGGWTRPICTFEGTWAEYLAWRPTACVAGRRAPGVRRAAAELGRRPALITRDGRRACRWCRPSGPSTSTRRATPSRRGGWPSDSGAGRPTPGGLEPSAGGEPHSRLGPGDRRGVVDRHRPQWNFGSPGSARTPSADARWSESILDEADVYLLDPFLVTADVVADIHAGRPGRRVPPAAPGVWEPDRPDAGRFDGQCDRRRDRRRRTTLDGSTSGGGTRSADVLDDRLASVRGQGVRRGRAERPGRIRPPDRLPADRRRPGHLQPRPGGAGAAARARRRRVDPPDGSAF